MSPEAFPFPHPPRWSRRRFFARMGGGLSLGAVAGWGCRLRHEALPQRSYVLRAPENPASSAADPGARRDGEIAEPAGILVVRQFRVSPPYDSRAFVVRKGESEFAADAYHGFLGSPGPMLTEALATWIRGWGVFATVTTGGSQLMPTHALEADVTELYADYRDPAAPRAVLAFNLRLLHPLAGPGSGLRWQRDARRSEPLPRPGPEELVAAWNRALEAICADLDPALFRRPPMPSMPAPQA